jgi:glycerate-2-kinase
MKLRIEPITAIVVSILLGWSFNQITSKPTCEIQTQTADGKVIVETYYQEYCDEIKANKA